MNDCTTTVCRNETSTYLCSQCVSDLQLWLDKVTETRQMLFTTMAKLDNTGPKNSEGGGGGSTGSAMPLREGAMDLRYALAIWEGRKASDLAHEEYAGGYVGELKRLIDAADKIVDLPPEQPVDHAANHARAIQAAPPMPTRDLVKFLRTEIKISIKPKDIRNWASRGKLQAVQREPLPTYWPHEIIQLHTERIKA